MEDDDELILRPDALGQVNLCHRGLEAVHGGIFSFAQTILVLDLSHNRLMELPAAIGGLVQLRELRAASNMLQSVGDFITRCAKLETLDVRLNRIEQLPEEMGKLAELTTLLVSENNIAALPPQVGSLRRLRVLHAQNNAITLVPPELARCKELTDADFSNNPVTNIPARFLADLDMIRWQCAHNLELAGRIQHLEGSGEELERLARNVGEQRMLLEERLVALQQQHEDLLHATRTYMGMRKAVTAVCTIM